MFPDRIVTHVPGLDHLMTAARILVVESLMRAFGVTPTPRAVSGGPMSERAVRKT